MEEEYLSIALYESLKIGTVLTHSSFNRPKREVIRSEFYVVMKEFLEKILSQQQESMRYAPDVIVIHELDVAKDILSIIDGFELL